MTRPSVVPTVDLPEGTGPTDPDVTAEGATDAPEFLPTQIWVRSATYTRGTYALTLATAPEGDFVLQDTRAVGGGQLIPGGNADPQCSKTSEKPLSAPIKGALENVTHLVTLTCHVTGALKRPAISGLWGDATHTGATSAIFALGDAKAQGRPQTDPDAPIQADQPVDTQVVSARYQGENVTVTAWATEYAAPTLAVAEAQDTNEFPECTTAVSPEHRPGVKTPTQQRLFTITCSNVKRRRRGGSTSLRPRENWVRRRSSQARPCCCRGRWRHPVRGRHLRRPHRRRRRHRPRRSSSAEPQTSAATCGRIARKARPRWLMAAFSSVVSSAIVRPSGSSKIGS